VLGGLVGFGQAPVPTDDGPPAGLLPRAWACYPTGVLPDYIVAADFNQNGWLDLAVSCAGSNAVWTYFNTTAIPGGPLFNIQAPIAVPGGPVALVTGHIGDTRTGNTAAAPLNEKLGAFDGHPDIGVLSTTNTTGNPSVVSWIAPTTGTPPPILCPNIVLPGLPINGILHIAGADFTHNNQLGLAVAANNNVYIYDWIPLDPGPPKVLGFYAAIPPSPCALPGRPVFVSTGDFDQNGWADVAVLCQGAGPGGTNASVQIFYNIRGTFIPGPNVGLFVPIVPTGMDVGDFNADGYPDLVIVGNVGARGFAQVLLNTIPAGTGAGFTALPAMATWGFNTRFVEVLDADGNGRDDFATANRDSDTITVFLTDVLPGLVNDNRPVDPPYCLCEAQRKRDRLDITFKLFKIELRCGHFPVSLAAGDYDYNGKMDLAVALESADKELCAQNPSCIEIDYDIACGFNANQVPHQNLGINESTSCPACKEPCGGNTPPSTEIQTESGTKNP